MEKNTYFSPRNLRFTLFEVLQAQQLNTLEYFQAFDEEAMELSLQAAQQLADLHLYPILREMDKNKAYFTDGQVHVHPKLGEAIRALGQGGWISAMASWEDGGQQMPFTILQACIFQFYAANANAASYAFLTQGAANLIQTYGSEELKALYIPDLYSGNWQGTMALTEPQAGSSLSDLTTRATPQREGHYLIEGQKIYISGGDYNAVDNVVHLLLARIEGAPPGTRGISLFVVPKMRPEGGKLLPNDVKTAGIYGKMGQKGYVAAHLMLGESGDCRGYLVGEPHQGLAYMFQMMNEARIATGMISAANASAAYYASLRYARERRQGRHPGQKDLTIDPVRIIEHADVRRLLLFQKSVTEGSLALLLQCCIWADQAHAHPDPDERASAHLLLELLTPIAKTYPAEMGFQAVNAGVQVLGGAGYTDDFPLEQYLRDIRVNAIYEGTSAIHGLDLLGRKVPQQKGAAMLLFMRTLKTDLEQLQSNEALQPYTGALKQAAQNLHACTMHLMKLAAEEDPRVFLADATLYLEYFGIVSVAWMWLRMARTALEKLQMANSAEERAFCQGKIDAMRYFIGYELVKTSALHERLLSTDRPTLDLDENGLD
jgi:alkylation response protein AidB-like acyl-CoA dehydrogenase